MVERVKLTKRYIERELPKEVTKEVWVYDTEVRAFGVRLRPTGRPVYAFRWKDRGSYRGHKFVIGPVGHVELEDARAIARQHLTEIAAGTTPAEKLAIRKLQEKTISDLIEDVREGMTSKGRADSYVFDFTQQMRVHVEPSIGHMRIHEVSATDVDRILAKIANRPALHNRVRAGLSSVFNAAMRARYRTDNPVLGTQKQTEHPRERLLNDAEMDALLAVLDRYPGQSTDVLRLLWLTGSRPQELFRARWQDFDLTAGTWSKPAQTVKQKRTHHVTLQKAAVALLRRMHELAAPRKSDWLFPSKGSTGHLTTIKRHAATVFREAGLTDVRPYDLRKSFTSRLVASGADLRTIMSITGHTQINILIRHYAHVMDGKQKEVLDRVFG